MLLFLHENDCTFFCCLTSHIDEIVLSYVVSILEELGSEWGQEELFDVESFSEMLTAYFPDFESIPHSNICDWIFNLSAELSNVTKGIQLLIIEYLESQLSVFHFLDTKDSKASLELGLKFPIPIATKNESQLSRVSESSDVSTSGESSHSSTQVNN